MKYLIAILFIVGCGEIETPVKRSQCEMKVFGRHVQKGTKCIGDFVATGVHRLSLNNPEIECASIDWSCP